MSSPSPYAAPDTPIASAKRPRFAKKDMRSPMRVTAAGSARPAAAGGSDSPSTVIGAGKGGAELRHKNSEKDREKEKEKEKKTSKALFSPSPHVVDGEEAGGGGGGGAGAGGLRDRQAGGGAGTARLVYTTVTSDSPAEQEQEQEGGPAAGSHVLSTPKRPASAGAGAGAGGTGSAAHSSPSGTRKQEQERERERERGAGTRGPNSPGGVGGGGGGGVSTAPCSSAAGTHAAAKDQQQQQQQQQEEEEEEDDGGTFNPYEFISSLPPVESVARHRAALPPKAEADAGKPTLVLDLDETLVHCTVDPIPHPDLTFPVTFNGTTYNVYVRKRPYLDYFLELVSRSFEVVVFTASQRVYADVLLDLLDPQRRLVRHRLFRESCLLVQGNYVKDLQVCGRDYRRTVLVDNSPHAYGFQPDNGVPIESWFDDDTDTELLKLAGFLRRAFAFSVSEGKEGGGGGGSGSGGDVRQVVREHFRTHELVDRAARGLYIDLSVTPPF